MFQDKNAMIIAAVIVGGTTLYLLKRYFAGGKCLIQKDLTDQIAVVTGGNTGIGKETVRRLSQLGCKVIIGARDKQKSQRLVQEISRQKNKGKVVWFTLDLADRKSIEQFAQQVKRQIGDKPLNYLVNNAGVMALPSLKRTKEGFEAQIGTNHFGHFYLTYLLWSSLKRSGNPRIINVSSRAHQDRAQGSKIDFDDINFQKGGYQAFTAYSRSKKSNILFTKQLQRRMNQANINGTTISLHPGVVRTQLGRYMIDTFWKKALMFVAFPFAFIMMKSSKEGAQTTLYGLLERQDKLKKGQYYADCKPSKLLSPQCASDEAAKKLWEISQKSFGIKFVL